MANLRSKLFETYLSFDTRSLALFRSALGLTCWVALGQHLCASGDPQPRSAFYGAASCHDAIIALACGVVFAALTVGAKTKWAQVLTFAAVASAAGRLGPLASPGDTLLVSLCGWSLFLPLGERFSIDSVRASLRRREQQAPSELNDRRPIRTPARKFQSLACLVLIAQWVAISLSVATALWADGVSYALHQERVVRPAGVWLREHASIAVVRGVSWTLSVVVVLATLAILSPVASSALRGFTAVTMPLVLIAAGVFVDLGIFTPAMIAFYPLLLDGRHWERISQAVASWHERRVVFVDEDCGFCMLCGRLLARLDVLERLEFASNADLDRLPRSISLAQADESITTLEPATGRVQRGAAAFAALLRSVPFGFLLAIPLELPGLNRFAEWAYMHVASNRLQLSLWLGYGACGLPGTAGTSPDVAGAKSPASVFVEKSLALARELCVAVILVVVASDPHAFERWRVSHHHSKSIRSKTRGPPTPLSPGVDCGKRPRDYAPPDADHPQTGVRLICSR